MCVGCYPCLSLERKLHIYFPLLSFLSLYPCGVVLVSVLHISSIFMAISYLHRKHIVSPLQLHKSHMVSYIITVRKVGIIPCGPFGGSFAA
jgi:hypothetical protein